MRVVEREASAIAGLASSTSAGTQLSSRALVDIYRLALVVKWTTLDVADIEPCPALIRLVVDFQLGDDRPADNCARVVGLLPRAQNCQTCALGIVAVLGGDVATVRQKLEDGAAAARFSGRAAFNECAVDTVPQALYVFALPAAKAEDRSGLMSSAPSTTEMEEKLLEKYIGLCELMCVCW